jgi:hypothetical protein
MSTLEKIKIFFEKCFSCFKLPEKDIPQLIITGKKIVPKSISYENTMNPIKENKIQTNTVLKKTISHKPNIVNIKLDIPKRNLNKTTIKSNSKTPIASDFIIVDM